MIRLLVIVLLAFLLYRVLRSALRSISAPRREPDGIIDEMVQDPQCKTYVPKRDARRRIIGGVEALFLQ